MHPVLIDAFGIRIYTYGVFVALGFLAGILYSEREAKRVGVDPDRVLDLTFWVLVAAIVGARTLFIITLWRDYMTHPAEILKIWKGGLVFYGGVLASILAIGIYVRRTKLPLLKTMDILSPAVMLGLFFGRWGCFSAGCCYGKPTHLPWGVTFTDPTSLATDVLGTTVHPTQIYESLAALVIFGVLQVFKLRKTAEGQVTWLMLMLYAFERFWVETLRGDVIRGFVWKPYLSTSQFISIPVFLAAAVLFARSLRRPAPAR